MVNGWTNRETWLINLHFGDSFGDENDVFQVRDMIEDAWNEASIQFKMFFDDYINFDLINWAELATHYK